MSRLRTLLGRGALAALAALPAPSILRAQVVPSVDRAERVSLPQSDGLTLSGRLLLPSGKGPFPGVVVLTLAGSDDLADRLNRLGFAVLLPNRRGLGGAPELLLRAPFGRLVEDVRTAEAYLRARADVDGSTIGLVGQGWETMVAALAAAPDPAGRTPAFVVLVGPPGFPGDEAFRIEQLFLAAQQGYDDRERAAIDALVTELDEIVTLEPNESLREYRIEALMLGTGTRLPRNPASLPLDVEGQVHFFASPWWRDFFMFDPGPALAGVSGPTLALFGDGDPLAPFRRTLPRVRAGLQEAPVEDVTECILRGYVQHSFSPTTLDAIEQWLKARLAAGRIVPRPGAERPAPCIDEKDAAG